MRRLKTINTKNLLVIIIASIILIVGLAITFLFFSNDDGGAKKTRTNISGLPTDLPNDTSALIKAGLYDAIALNIPDNETPPTSGAIVRSGSLEEGYDEDTNLHYGNFITDLESLKLSFSIHYEWTNDKNNAYMSGYPVVITCVEKNEDIYNMPSCSDSYHQADPLIDDFAEKYLPYITQTETGIDYNIIKDYSDTEPIIAVVSYTCEGTDRAKEVKAASEAWIKSTGVKIDSSKILQKNYCDGMMDNFPPVVKIY